MAASVVNEAEPRVFITNYAGHTYTKAETFGALKWLTKGYVSFGSLDRLRADLAAKIIDMTRPDDFLLLSGNSALCSFAALLWFFHHGQVKLLVHDKKSIDDSYRVVLFTSENMRELFRIMGAQE